MGGSVARDARPSILTYAGDVLGQMQSVLVERGASYADIADNSRVFATILRNMGVTVPEGMSDTEFHCIANIATKLARRAVGDPAHEDTWVDIANYAVLQLADMRRTKDMK